MIILCNKNKGALRQRLIKDDQTLTIWIIKRNFKVVIYFIPKMKTMLCSYLTEHDYFNTTSYETNNPQYDNPKKGIEHLRYFQIY